VSRARLECNRIQWEAHANAEARDLSDAKARYLFNQADLKGARTVLKVLSIEYADAGLNLKQFWAAMRDEIDSVANSFSLYDTQRRLLEAEFSVPPEQKVSARPRPSTAAPASPKADRAMVVRSRPEMRSLLRIEFPSSRSRVTKTAFSWGMYIVSSVRVCGSV
jgi:hypothetical protein